MTGLLESVVRKLSFVWTHDRSVCSFSRLRKSPAGLAFKATEKLDPDVSELLSSTAPGAFWIVARRRTPNRASENSKRLGERFRGYEAVQMIRKGQARWVAGNDLLLQIQFIDSLFELAA